MNHIPVHEQDDLISAYYSRLTSDDDDVRKSAALNGPGGKCLQVN